MTIQNILLDQSYNEQIKLHGRTREAVLETIRVCRDRNILKDYLESREQEVVNIMMTLFDEEYILKTYIEQEKRDAAEKAVEEAAKQATQKVKRETAQKSYQKGTSLQADYRSLTGCRITVRSRSSAVRLGSLRWISWWQRRNAIPSFPLLSCSGSFSCPFSGLFSSTSYP